MAEKTDTETALIAVPPSARVRMVRVITYEGPVDWILSTLKHSVITKEKALFALSEGKTIVCTAEEITIL